MFFNGYDYLDCYIDNVAVLVVIQWVMINLLFSVLLFLYAFVQDKYAIYINGDSFLLCVVAFL